MSELFYTIEEVAQILKVSKLTVYTLVKKGKLSAHRVGRQMRVDASDLEAYKANTKEKGKDDATQHTSPVHYVNQPSWHPAQPPRPIIVSGQDICLDLLAKYIEKQAAEYRPLRSYVGSLNSLIAMYQGEADIVSTHLYDGDTNEYNIPYIRKILVGHRYVVVNLISRSAGLYVKKGNPQQIITWADLIKPGVKIINREKGSGARVLLDEQLRIHDIPWQKIAGYETEETSHLSVAGAIVNNQADVGVGIEKAAYIVGVDFIPLIKERYDLVILKSLQNDNLIEKITHILRASSFQNELQSIGGYDLSQTGKIIYETF